MEGWIKLHRQMKEHWIWKSENRLKWWIDILLTVNHADAKVLVKGKLTDCKKGQSIRSLESWARDWNVSKGAVRDFFKLLQSDQMLLIESLQFTTRITVCKYEDYQTEVIVKKTQKKRSGNAQETLGLPKQECKEGKECKEDTTTTTTTPMETWRTSFPIYLKECSDAFRAYSGDPKLVADLEYFYPTVNVLKSLENSFNSYWKLEKTWEKKRNEKHESINWVLTITNSIKSKFNTIYYSRAEQIEIDKKREEAKNELIFSKNGL